MNRLIVQLTGGLGNQMFQYAAARALAARQSAELVLDTWSGFARDRQYRRHYELGPFQIQARVATPLERLPIWLYRLDTRFRRRPTDLLVNRLYGQFIVESASRYYPEVAAYRLPKTAWMFGYWQSPRYFDDYAHLIREELAPQAPNDRRFLDLAKDMRGCESLALGIRLYEESLNPAAHARDGAVKTVADISQAIDHLLSEVPGAHVYVFCTHRSPVLAELGLPLATTFVTHDDGYQGTVERLWLLSQCRHHLITNSTFYWWGAWLSRRSFPDRVQHILASDNFTNREALPVDWQQF